MQHLTWLQLVQHIKHNPKLSRKRFQKLLKDEVLRKIDKWSTAKAIVQHVKVHQCDICGTCKADYQA